MTPPVDPAPPARPVWRRSWFRLGVLGVGCATAVALVILLRPRPRPDTAPEVPGASLVVADPDIADAVERARAAVARNPASPATWGELGQVLQVHKFLEPALECYAQAARLDPRNPDWPYLKATIHLVGPEPHRAIDELRRAAELAVGDQLPRLRLGEVLSEQGRPDEAAAEFRAALEAGGDSPRAHLGLARVAVVRHDWNECLRHLDTVGDAVPARKEVAALRAAAYQNLGDAPAARREESLLARLPDDPPWPDPVRERLSGFQVGMMARLVRAQQLMRGGDVPRAMSLVTAVVCDYPESDAGWLVLGRTLAETGDLSAAEAALLKALDVAPGVADAWASLGLVRQKKSDPAGALECFRNMTRLKPNDAGGHFRAGECLEALGDRAGAADAYREALRHQPDYPGARDRLDRLRASP